MNPLYFGAEAAKAWAAFSGDYNPIHFDPQFARNTIGSEGTVVHGMLAMLGLKQASARADWPEEGWLQWTGMLKQAMPGNVGYTQEVNATGPGSKIRFKLGCADGQGKNILGNCAEVDFDSHRYMEPPRYSIAAEDFRGRLASFCRDFPDVHCAWIALDALMFAEYIQKHSINTFRDDIIRRFGPEMELDFGRSSMLTMQTHHRDTFRSRLLKDLSELQLERIDYGIRKIDEIMTADSLFATIDIPVWLDGDLSLVVQIGLMARKKT